VQVAGAIAMIILSTI